MSEHKHKIAPPPMEPDENITRCPWCGKVNPDIRRVPAVAGGARVSVVSIIFSCGNCKKIISIQQLPPIETPEPATQTQTSEEKPNASPNAEFSANPAADQAANGDD